MNILVIELMKLINSYGYECYIVGGFIRDKLLNIDSYDYDLCTNALTKDLIDMLNKYNITSIKYGTLTILINNLKVEITTYRKEINYYKRKPIEYIFVNTLEEDLLRRDFTINSICLDVNNNIIDLLGGINDIDNKIIRCIGDSEYKIKQDPLRILRALRFSASLNFSIESNLESIIIKYKNLLKDLSYERKKEEINKLINIRRLDIIKKYNLEDILEIDIDNFIYYDDYILNWMQIDKYNKYIIRKKEQIIVSEINEFCKLDIDNYNVYKYGIHISMLVGKIKKIDILDIYNKLPIKTRKDINITSLEIISIINKSNKVNLIYNELEYLILNNKLQNDHDIIVSYLKLRKHTI